MDEFIQVITTTTEKAEAERIARALVEMGLAGCVQIIGPILSIYRWQGTIEEAPEWLCLIKTSRASYAEVEATLRCLHSYETPEILAVPIVAGSAAYLRWLAAVLEAPQG